MRTGEDGSRIAALTRSGRWALCALLLAACATQPQKLYPGPRLPDDDVSIVSTRGLDEIEKVDKQVVNGRAVSLEPGPHLLEFLTRSKERVRSGSMPSMPIYTARCYRDGELDRGHTYLFESRIEVTLPEVREHDGYTWRLVDVEASLIDETTGEAVEGLVCPSTCRAVGRAGGRSHQRMTCDDYLRSASGTPAPPTEEPAPDMSDLVDRVIAECSRRGRRGDLICLAELSANVITAESGSGEQLIYVPEKPEDLLPDSRQKATDRCGALTKRTKLDACLGANGWKSLP